MIKKNCFHCNSLIYNNDDYCIIINGITRYMCCPGCLAVAKFIIDAGFADYYSYRNSYNLTVNEKFIENEYINETFFFKKNENIKNLSYNSITIAIDGITCSACTWLIERHLRSINGIYNVYVNLSTCRANISYDSKTVKLNFIINEFKKIGYLAYPYTAKKQEEIHKNEYRREIKKLIISAIGMSQVMMLSVALYIGEAMDMHKNYWIFIRWMCFFFTFPVLVFSAKTIFLNAYKNIIYKNFSMDITISLSLIIAFLMSIWNVLLNFGDIYFDSICMFIFFLQLSRFLELRARHYSNDIILGLQNFITSGVTLKKKNILIKTQIDNVKISDVMIIKSGEIIPLDGEIIDGCSYINESMITGEPVPICKIKGDYVVGGTLNLDNTILVKTLKTKGSSTIDVIIKLLEKSQSTKPKYNVLADFISGYFVVTVIILTFTASIIWTKIGNENLLNIILCMLVIACPCALSLATPIALTSSINILAKKGFLITKEHVLENLNSITDIIFDKTGTLTVNNFIINKIKLNKKNNITDVIRIALTLEEQSNHPIAKAFLIFKKNNIKNKIIKSNIKNFLSEGIEGKINDVYYRIGNEIFIKNWTKNYKKISFNNFGINIILADKNNIIAWFNLINPMRNNLKECIQNLKKINLNLHILSGDGSNEVDYIADELNIENKNKNFSSKQKLDYIKNLQKNGSKILMIGDGINDTLALNNSQISVAMGNAADLTKINSDVILLNNDLMNIYISIIQGKKNNIIIKQNIFWSILYNITGLTCASLNLLTPYYAAIGMSLSSLIVVFNSLRLKKYKIL